MHNKTKEITQENFSKAVDHAYALNKKMHTNVLAMKVLFPLGSILLALHSMILFLGAIGISVQDKPERLIAFNALPFIQKYWNGVWEILSNITDLLYAKIILMVVFLLLVPFIFSSVAAILISCFVKTKEPEIKGDTAKQAKQLYTYLDNSPNTYFYATEGVPAIWRRICGIVSGLCIILFVLYFYGTLITQSSEFLPALSALFQSEQNTEDILICLVFGVLFYFPYAFLHYIFTLTIQPYCDSYKKWKKAMDKAECYWLSVDKDERERREQKKREEEEKRAQAAKSYLSSSKSSPGLSFEFKMNYINSHFGGIYSFAAIQYIESDPSLSPSEKEEMIIFLRAYGD